MNDDDEEAHLPATVTVNVKAYVKAAATTTTMPTTHRGGNAHATMTTPLPQDDDDKNKSSGCSSLMSYSYCCYKLRRGRRWSRFNMTAGAFMLSAAAMLIGLVLLILSIQAGKERQANEASNGGNANIIRPTEETVADLQEEFWALHDLVRMKDTDDDNDNMDYDPYDHVVLPDSPQWKALEWLVSKDPAQLYSVATAAGTTGTAKTVARLKQRYALAVVYFHFGGSAWTLPPGSGWLSEDTGTDMDAANVANDECNWLGVVCGDTDSSLHEITALEMGPHVAMATTGVLPSELGLLTALTTLDLADKGLLGTIPVALYRRLTDLQYLDIGLNKLVSLGPEISHWTKLQTLILSNNDLYGTLPTQLFSLVNLKVLLLQFNPSASGRLLESIDSWPSMELLDISFTNVSGTLSSQVGTLTNLKRLGATFLPLTGRIPDEIAACTQLEELSLGEATGIGGLTGTIPASLGMLTNLIGLAFPMSDLSGTMPTQVGQLSKLRILDIHSISRLTGTLPTELGKLTDLVMFKMAGTALTGTIPTELGQATKLYSFEVQDTELSGTIPEELCSLVRAGSLLALSARCLARNSTGIYEPARVECGCSCFCYL
jgi:hypothetical protein